MSYEGSFLPLGYAAPTGAGDHQRVAIHRPKECRCAGVNGNWPFQCGPAAREALVTAPDPELDDSDRAFIQVPGPFVLTDDGRCACSVYANVGFTLPVDLSAAQHRGDLPASHDRYRYRDATQRGLGSRFHGPHVRRDAQLSPKGLQIDGLPRRAP